MVSTPFITNNIHNVDYFLWKMIISWSFRFVYIWPLRLPDESLPGLIGLCFQSSTDGVGQQRGQDVGAVPIDPATTLPAAGYSLLPHGFVPRPFLDEKMQMDSAPLFCRFP